MSEPPKGTPGQPLSEERWRILLECLRHEENLESAARAARCNWRTVRRAYEHGVNGRRPIKVIIAEEQTMRRALVSEQVQETEAARTAAVLELERKAVALEERIAAAGAKLEQQSSQLEKLAVGHVDAAKRARTRLLETGGLDAAEEYKREGVIARALQSFTQARIGLAMVAMRADVIENIGRVIVEAGTRRDLDLATAMRLANHLGRDAKAVAELAALSQEVTRKWLGAPTQITAVEHTVTLDAVEFAEKLADLQRIRAQLEEHGVHEETEVEVVEAPPALPPATCEELPPDEEALARAQAHWAERGG